MSTHDYLLPMARLFTGNTRSYGLWNPVTGRVVTVKDKYNDDLFIHHLDGQMGLGLSPILDDGTCWFGAVDIDTHGPSAKAVDIISVCRRIDQYGLPVVPCKSKSGTGMHLYIFYSKPVSATTARSTLERIATQVGHANAEIFPKQTVLQGDSLGSWINLPYFDYTQTQRPALGADGHPLNIEQFFAAAERVRASGGKLTNLQPTELSTEGLLPEILAQGPPCLQRIVEDRLEEGGRNEAIYQAAVMLKKAGISGKPADPLLAEYGSIAFANPLSAREITVTGRSVAKKDNYYYKCKSSPFAERCDKVLCKVRKYGVRSGDEVFNDVPRIERIIRFVGEVTTWRVYIEGVARPLDLTTEEITEFKKLNNKIFEATLQVMAPMKQADWQLQLAMIMKDPALTVETERGVSLTDIFRRDVIEFVKRASREDNRAETAKRADLLRGMPAYCQHNGTGPAYAFRDTALIDWLQKRRKLMGSRTENYNRLRDALGEDARGKIEVDGKDVEVWWVAPTLVDDQDIPPRVYETEF